MPSSFLQWELKQSECTITIPSGELTGNFHERTAISSREQWVQATVNYDRGNTWDLETDRIIVESKTPKGMPQSG